MKNLSFDHAVGFSFGERIAMPNPVHVAVLRAASRVGLFKLVLRSEWRRRRLPILCYHGISTDDEHLCFPGFFMPARMFEARLERLKRMGIHILPLEEALERLEAGTLPPRSAVLTMDDGFYGAYAVGQPILRRYGYPVTVYMTTYYVCYNVPVFDPMVGYLLWKTSVRVLEWPEVLSGPIVLDHSGRDRANASIRAYALHQRLCGNEKNDLLKELADRLGIGYQDLCRRRMFHLVDAGEVKGWAKEADFQLHSHRHRLSRNKETFWEQLRDNQEHLESITGKKCRHFCYPGGTFLSQFPDWIREYGLQSAVTCETGLATRDADRMLLPRIMDTATLSKQQFESWITGARAWLPIRRRYSSQERLTQLLEDEAAVLDDLAAGSGSPRRGVNPAT